MKITEEELTKFIEEPYLSRGWDYFRKGMVELISINSTGVKAKSMGTRLYDITLKLKGEALMGTCSCPAFEDFGPCKHIAATGFALIQNESKGYEPSEIYVQRKEFYGLIKKLLLKKSKEELVALILRASDDYPEILEEIE